MNRAARGLLRSTLRARRREFVRLTGWSLVQAVPALLSGWLVARAVDDGFLAGRSAEGLGWLGLLACAALLGAWGTRQATLQLAGVVEPFRDDLVTLVTTGTLQRSARLTGPADTAGVARLTEQVEIARESYGAIVMFVQTFSVTAVSVLLGLAVLDPALLLFVLPPLAAGLALFLLALRAMAARQRAVVLADEAIAEQVGAVADGLRDVTACGAEDVVRARVGVRIDAAADAARALARLTAVRTAALGVGGWLPIVLILAGTPWLVRGGVTTGAVLGALTYVSQSLQPALRGFVQGLGGSGLWLLVTLTRILEASTPTAPAPTRPRPADTSPGNTPSAADGWGGGTTGILPRALTDGPGEPRSRTRGAIQDKPPSAADVGRRAAAFSPRTAPGRLEDPPPPDTNPGPNKTTPAAPGPGSRKATTRYPGTATGKPGMLPIPQKDAPPDNTPPPAPSPGERKVTSPPKTGAAEPGEPPVPEKDPTPDNTLPPAPSPGSRKATTPCPSTATGKPGMLPTPQKDAPPDNTPPPAPTPEKREATSPFPTTVTGRPEEPPTPETHATPDSTQPPVPSSEKGAPPANARSVAPGRAALRAGGRGSVGMGGRPLPLGGSTEPDGLPAISAGPGAPARASPAPQPRDGRVELCGVTFGYARSAEPVVRGLDLVLASGTHLAVVGPSGAGKSTLAALMAGVLEPRAGRIRLGGVPVRELDRERLSRSRVLIPQEAYVFTGTLRENLAYLQPAATTAELDSAVRAIGAQALVRRLGGYDATLDPAVLSAGERQLIALVRALLPSARLVVLDEATCHLDPAAEAVAERAFARRPATLIVCAHRISSALRADLVLVMDGSRCRLGTHDQLMADCALYRDLIGHWDGRADATRPSAGGELAYRKGT
ncbi:ATP-binding cassette domain-containing protein [Streptomyces guryensis]|uniref:ATP-binding cassette domain-containing protein n=1 Tax=Streptomyces guryensis TaxID=2886947 RepID=A0A9Q3VP79_9ACTN|nr:ABC transporter ATP-binding protein [Streptomyces guryensis]MCD9875941.1 ATP-binding cassette domain-containing protein [Streptomyces guryensis]